MASKIETTLRATLAATPPRARRRTRDTSNPAQGTTGTIRHAPRARVRMAQQKSAPHHRPPPPVKAVLRHSGERGGPSGKTAGPARHSNRA